MIEKTWVISVIMPTCFIILPGTLLSAAKWNPLPDTGQNTCYDHKGRPESCPEEGEWKHGQDAQYYGSQPSYTLQAIGGDKIVVDNNTKLIWLQKTADTNRDGQITNDDFPAGDRMSMDMALDYCDSLTYAGASNWRLPNATELESIVDYGIFFPGPLINPIFDCEKSFYMTSTGQRERKIHWSVHFESGNTASVWASSDGNSDIHFVRCVR